MDTESVRIYVEMLKGADIRYDSGQSARELAASILAIIVPLSQGWSAEQYEQMLEETPDLDAYYVSRVAVSGRPVRFAAGLGAPLAHAQLRLQIGG